MKALYISGHAGADFLDNMLFHGMRTLLGDDCVDVEKQRLMYQGGEQIGFHSIYGKLPDIPIDREDIPAKIRSHYFDVIVYGSINRSRMFIDDVLSAYHRNEIAMIDGEDDHDVSPIRDRGLYFKRELNGEPYLPIQFCIPSEMVIPIADLPKKSRLIAHCDPRDRSTYVYYDERAYYRQYSESYFGYTMKKGGWDCSRHYEILAAGCLPYFAGIESCPERTMFRLSRPDLLAARELCDNWMPSRYDLYLELLWKFRRALLDTMTTEAMAKYVLETLRQ